MSNAVKAIQEGKMWFQRAANACAAGNTVDEWREKGTSLSYPRNN